MLAGVSEKADRISSVFMVVLLSAMVVVVFAQVLWRYAFHASIFWSEELSRYLMVWATMVASGVCLRRGAHMAIRFMHDLLPPWARKATGLLVHLAMLAFLGYVFWYSIVLVQKTWTQISPTLRLPMGMVYLCVPLGAALMGLQVMALLEKIWRHGTVDDPAGAAGRER